MNQPPLKSNAPRVTQNLSKPIPTKILQRPIILAQSNNARSNQASLNHGSISSIRSAGNQPKNIVTVKNAGVAVSKIPVQRTFAQPENTTHEPGEPQPSVWNELQKHVAQKLIKNLDFSKALMGTVTNTNSEPNGDKTAGANNGSNNKETSEEEEERLAAANQVPLFGCFTDIFDDEFFHIGAKSCKKFIHNSAKESLGSIHQNVAGAFQQQVNKVITNTVLGAIGVSSNGLNSGNGSNEPTKPQIINTTKNIGIAKT